jgi:hypothetical protein
LFVSPSWLPAAKPTPPPPPPPPANPFEIYEDRRADLGGWLDTERNLIWGYSLVQTRNNNCSYSGAQWFAQNYADQLAAEVDVRLERAAYNQDQGDVNQALGDQALADGDLALADYYYGRADLRYALAEQYAADAVAFDDAAVVADQFTNWRVPTKVEAVDASAKGLFTYGEGGFNSWDPSPATGMQSLPVMVFTNDLSKNRQNAWAFFPADGGTMLTSVNSSIDCIVVRTHVP